MDNRKPRSNTKPKGHKDIAIDNRIQSQIKYKPWVFVDTDTGEVLNKKQVKEKQEREEVKYVEESTRYEREMVNPFLVKMTKISYGKFKKNKNQQLTLFNQNYGKSNQS